MRFKGRIKRSTRNWENDPDFNEERDIGIDVGSLVSFSEHLTATQSSAHDDNYIAYPVAPRGAINDECEHQSPHLDGVEFGVYLGMMRVKINRKLTHNHRHWSGTQRMHNCYELFHFFQVGQHRVIIEPKFVKLTCDT